MTGTFTLGDRTVKRLGYGAMQQSWRVSRSSFMARPVLARSRP